MTRPPWTDEQISSWLDGELAAGDAKAIERDLESDPAFAERVQRVASANRAFIAAIGEIDRHPPSEGVERILAAPPTAKVIPFRASRIAAYVMEHRAIAAALVCAAAVWSVSSGLQSGGNTLMPATDGVILASSPLHRALETGASSQTVRVAGNLSVTPRLTFASADGGYCRQFDLAAASSGVSAIACREDGRWRTQLIEFGKPVSTGDYQAASGERSPALEAFIDQHISGAPLNAEDESKLLSQGWSLADR